MKVINLSFADSAGAAYFLSHATNKYSKDVQMINLRANNNYISYPTIAEVAGYSEEGCRNLVYDADVIVFHSAIKPFFSALHLDKDKMKGKKKVLYFHGSDARNFGEAILKQADEVLGEYGKLVSTPDLLEIVRDAEWMPCARDIDGLQKTYGVGKRDEKALKAFGGAKKRVILGHAPTNKQLKGTALFYKIITEVVDTMEGVQFFPIEQVSWFEAMRRMSVLDVFFDQCVLMSYGMAAVEAGAFKVPVFCLLSEFAAIQILKMGGVQPFIQWADEDALRTQVFMIADDAKIRRKFGSMMYEYVKRVHDEKPVVARFTKFLAKL